MGAGFVLTVAWVGSYRKRPDRTAHGYAAILSIGFMMTWLASILAPVFAVSHVSAWGNAIVFTAIMSVSTGLMTYFAVRLWFWLAKRRAK